MLEQYGMTIILYVCLWQTLQLHLQSWVSVGVLQWLWNCLLRVAHMPFHHLSLSRNRHCPRLQWECKFHHWYAEWQNVMFSDVPLPLVLQWRQHNVRCYHCEYNLRICIDEQHNGQIPSVMVWYTIGYNMWSHFLRVHWNLNSNPTLRRLQCQVTAFPSISSTFHISAGQCPTTYSEDSASLLQRTTGITASLASTFTRHDSYQTSLGYGWFVGKLFSISPPATTLDGLWTHIQTAWREIP